jgi:hypothetical protein
MNLQYISDDKGKRTAVVIPIDKWNLLIKKYKNLDNEIVIKNAQEIPVWQKEIVMNRIKNKQEPVDAFEMLNTLENEKV